MATAPTPTNDKLHGLRRDEHDDIAAILPYLDREDGLLTLYRTPYDGLWGSAEPSLIYLPDRARDNARSLKAAFAQYFDVSLHFPLKSCYLPAIATALRADGHGVEVMSDLEWQLARRFGFTPEQVVANSPARTSKHRRELIAAETGLIGVDSVAELERIEDEARSQSRIARIAVRVNPLNETGAFFTAGSKLGADLDGAADLVERALASRWCDVAALHAHQLRHCTDAHLFHRMVRGLAELAVQTAPADRPFPTVNLGGGLESRFLLERSGAKADDFAEAARDALGMLPVTPSVILEPGRYVVGDAAVGLTNVVGRKVNSSETWLISDLSSNVLIPLPDLAYHPVPLRLAPDTDWERVHVGDATCAPSHLCRSAELPSTAALDGLAVLNCGAYTSVYAELWAFPLPRIGVFEDGQLREVFGPPQEADMFRALYGSAATGGWAPSGS
ncbi:diaminopimelate decarboxylase family protein [Streptomyces sp. NPDC057623]|uniref:diaminopimelate decarboxylase family protein n=1 Tax=Streptomyces sp. NPDC057623 TaxID=3346187 RepID=UPI0036AE4810